MAPFGGESADSYYDEGLTAMMKGDVQRASELFECALKLDGNLAAAKHQLGKCYLRMGDAQRAADTLSQTLARKPDLSAAQIDYGYALLALASATDDTRKQAVLDLARKQFVGFAEAHPDNARGYLGLAQAAFQSGDWSTALSLAQEARARGGASFNVLFLIGRAAKLSGAPTLAEQALKEAASLVEKSTELNPDMPECHYLRGEVSFAQEAFPAALDHYRAAEDRTESGRTYTAFGEVFAVLDVLAKRGLCHQRMHDLENARRMGRQILEQAPEHRLGRYLADL